MNNTENLLEQLVRLVGSLKAGQEEIKSELKVIKEEQQEMKIELKNTNSRVDRLEQKMDLHHKEMINKFKNLKADQDFIWEKAVSNEREIQSLKRQ